MFINTSTNLRYDNFPIVHYSINLIAIYSIMAVIGIVGNVVTCIVIVSNKSMHTATNCYLFNLAISDLLILTWGPPIFNNASYSSEFICKLRALIAKTSLNVAITIVCVLSVERYFAICHPFLASKRQLSSLSHAMKAIPVMWSIGVLGALPLALQYGLVHHVDEPTMIGCRKINKIITYLEGIRSLLIFAVPMLIICTMYTLIGLRLKRSSKTIRNHNDPTDRTKQRAPKMLVVVVAAFIVCQMPIHVIRMFRIHNSLYKSLTKMFDKTTWFFVTDVSHIMYYLSSLINPILYNTMSRKFRIAFKNTIFKCCNMKSFPTGSISEMSNKKTNSQKKTSMTCENQF